MNQCSFARRCSRLARGIGAAVALAAVWAAPRETRGQGVINPLMAMAGGTAAVDGLSQDDVSVFYIGQGVSMRVFKDNETLGTAAYDNFYVIDAGSFGTNGLKLSYDGNIYITSNTEVDSNFTLLVVDAFHVGTNFTAIGSALEIGDRFYAGLLSDVGGVHLLDIAAKSVGDELFRVGPCGGTTGLDNYLAVGGNSLDDIRFLVPSATDASFYDFSSSGTSFIKYDGTALNEAYNDPTMVLNDLVIDSVNPSQMFLAYNHDEGGFLGRMALVDGFTPQAAIPEPATYALCVGGLIGATVILRRRGRKNGLYCQVESEERR